MSKNKTNEELPEVTQYFESIRKYKPLSADEERELGKRIEQGDQAAINQLVNANLRYVITEAKRYRSTGVPFSDLISEGNLGLVRAAQRFDWRKGFKFITYAVWYIRQAIRDLVKTFACNTEYTECNLPDTNIPYEQVLTISEKESDDMEDAIISTRSRDDAIATLTKCLKDKELYVLQKYFGLNGQKTMTLLEIGKEFGVSKERVRQIKDKAMVKLRCNALVSDEFATMRDLC